MQREVRNRALFFLGLGTGMRVGDVVPHGRVLDEVVLEKHSTKSSAAGPYT